MSDYILGLRKLVGRRALLQVGAGVLVENEGGQLLLQRRADNGLWGYCGGSVELDEQVEAAARRELLEETGLVARELTLFGVFSGRELHYIYPNGDEVSNIEIVYLCRAYSGELQKQESEVTELRFFSPDQIPASISPPCRPILRAYLQALSPSV